ncbi:MAG: thioredoxin family protein [Bacteroidota bacterium]|nr:thioredoxin family protein [Bacteroidota bacterium]
MSTNYTTIENISHYSKILSEEDAVLIYYSHQACNVCKVLKPKIAELIHKEFPKIKLYYADTRLTPEIAGQNRVFTVPTISIILGGREYIRKSRNISINELSKEIDRGYHMMFKTGYEINYES